MRDIRSDLQERARLVEHEITTVNSRFQNTIEQLQKERDKRVAELNAELGTLRVLIETEEARLANAQRPVAPGQHQYTLSDFRGNWSRSVPCPVRNCVASLRRRATLLMSKAPVATCTAH